MTRDGAVEQNTTAGEQKRISKRDKRFDLRVDNSNEIVNDTENIAFGNVGDIVKSEDTPIKSGNRTDDGSSSQVGITLNRNDIIADEISGKRKTLRIRRKQTLSKDIYKGDKEMLPLLTEQTYKSSKNSTALFTPIRPPFESQAAISDFHTLNEDGKIFKIQEDTNANPSHNSEISHTDGFKSTEKILHKSKITYRSKVSVQLNEQRISNVRKTSKSRKFTAISPIVNPDRHNTRKLMGSNNTSGLNSPRLPTQLSKNSKSMHSAQLPSPTTQPPLKQEQQAGSIGSATSPNANAPMSTRKTSKLDHQLNKTTKKLDKAKSNLPTRHRVSIERTLDGNMGKTDTRLRFDKEVKSQADHLKGPVPLRPIRFGVNAAIAKAHMKIYQVEHENVGTQAAHKVELAGEATVRSALRHRKLAPYKKAAKLERKLSKRSAKLAYNRTLEANPRLNKNPIARLWQKRKIKRQHAKALREAQKAAGNVKKAGSLTAKATRAVAMFIRKNPKVIIAVVALFIFVNIISSLFGMLAGIGNSGAGAIFATTYLAEEADIEAVSLAYNRWEMDLMMEILNAEQNHPGFDEYRFNTGDISHNPFALIAYLTATRLVFTLDDVEAELRVLFDEQYQLSFTPSIETRFHEREDDDGNIVRVPYDWHVMTVTLIARNFTDVIFNRMTAEQRLHFNLLTQTRGQRQIVANPFNFSWAPFITSAYGYRIHPITGVRDLHRGIDIGVPMGTEILAGFNGTVTFAGVNGGYGNVVIIQGDNGLEARYAHMHTISVTTGQSVDVGDVIGTVGSTGSSTGPHLHMEVLRNGQFLNPIFFVDLGNGNFNFNNPSNPPTNLPNNNPPRPPMSDYTWNAMIAEAELHLGKPYVFGANGPNAFDCSSFVSWVLRESGIRDVGRQTAQGLFNLSSIVTDSPQRGDLVFFHSTYNTYRLVTHVGIFAGYDINGRPVMIHAGSPVQYAHIDTSFWQRHFLAFGRID